MSRPFQGIKVIDLTHVLAGPFCAYQLAVLGAETIKIERPGEPDQVRQTGTDRKLNQNNMGTNYLAQGSNKRSLTLDLKTEVGRDILKRLVAESDVFIENYRSGAMAALGLGYEDLRAIKPDLIYCSVTGFGQEGPKAEHTAYDGIIQAASGVMSVTGTPEITPLKVGAPVIDYACGAMAAYAVAAALFQRSQTGAGQYIDVSMLDSALMLLSSTVTAYLYNRRLLSVPRGNEYSTANGSCYQTEDGLLMLAALNPRQHERLWHVLGRPDLAELSSYEAIEANNEMFKRELTIILATRTASEWEDLLNDAGVPASRVRSLPETLDHPQLDHRGVLHRHEQVAGVDGPVTVPVTGFTFLHDGPRIDTPPPRMGADSDAVLAELGFTLEEIAVLRASGVV